ncbi:MAG: flavodoxin family protein [Firmicutes bacterium]|nr:flavodoxin family protein [Bacillota bacterium]
MKNLLAISSSPRRKGNSEVLLQSFLHGAEEAGWNIDHVRINNLKINFCQACDWCANSGECIQKDDMQAIYPKVVAARAMVLATPVYFGTMSGQAKVFVDRFQCWWQAKYNIKKPLVDPGEKRPGYFICVSALKGKNYCENALAAVKVFYHNINYHYTDSIFFEGADEKGAIKQYPRIIEEAYEKGRLL